MDGQGGGSVSGFPDTQEAEIKSIRVRGQNEQKFSETPSQSTS
jgi:hypothetical protein